MEAIERGDSRPEPKEELVATKAEIRGATHPRNAPAQKTN